MHSRKSTDSGVNKSHHKKKPSIEIKQLETTLKKTQTLIKKLRQNQKRNAKDSMKNKYSRPTHSKKKSKHQLNSMI